MKAVVEMCSQSKVDYAVLRNLIYGEIHGQGGWWLGEVLV